MKYAVIKKIVINFLKGKFIRLALQKVLGSAVAGGIQGYIVSYIAKYLFSQIFIPLFNYVEDKGMLYYDQSQGRIKYKTLEQAKENSDEDTYNSTIDDV